MKIIDGLWLHAAGVTPHFTRRAIAHSLRDGVLEILAVAQDEHNRVSGPAMRLRLSAALPGVVRVELETRHDPDPTGLPVDRGLRDDSAAITIADGLATHSDR